MKIVHAIAKVRKYSDRDVLKTKNRKIILVSIRFFQKISYYDEIFLFEKVKKITIIDNLHKKNTIFALLF